jgi:hypothetical protein
MKWVRRMRLAATIGTGAVLLTCLILFLTAQHIPAWYVPIHVADDKSEQQRVRDSLTEAVDRFRAGLAAGQPFEFRIGDRTINEWVVARAEIYPESADWLPAWLNDPVLHFASDGIMVGARYDRDGWKAILSLHFEPRAQGDEPGIRVQGVEVGSLPVPTSWIRDRLQQSGILGRIRAEHLPGSVRRMFLESPGDAPANWLPLGELVRDDSFKVLSVATNPGELVLNIQPLERRRTR